MTSYHVASPPSEKPMLLYDGDCSFCRKWAERGRRWTKGRVEFVSCKEVIDRFQEIPVEACDKSIHLIEPSGEVYSAAAAAFRSMAFVPGRRWIASLYDRFPGFAPVAETAYRLIARHRHSCGMKG